MPQSSPSMHAHFGSLEECIEFLGRALPAGAASGSARAGEQDDVPAYLFRGEPGSYGSTLPSSVRTLRAIRCSAVRDFLIDLEGDFLCEFEDAFGARTVGFLQHYGVPTHYVEFTSSLTMAAFFACRQGEGGAGTIGVLDVGRAQEHCSILDLSHHPLARHPGRQQAYAVRCATGSDYKDPRCCELIGMRWYSFDRRETDAELARTLSVPLEPIPDQVAEWMRSRVSTQRSRLDGVRPEVVQLLGMIEARLS